MFCKFVTAIVAVIGVVVVGVGIWFILHFAGIGYKTECQKPVSTAPKLEQESTERVADPTVMAIIKELVPRLNPITNAASTGSAQVTYSPTVNVYQTNIYNNVAPVVTNTLIVDRLQYVTNTVIHWEQPTKQVKLKTKGDFCEIPAVIHPYQTVPFMVPAGWNVIISELVPESSYRRIALPSQEEMPNDYADEGNYICYRNITGKDLHIELECRRVVVRSSFLWW